MLRKKQLYDLSLLQCQENGVSMTVTQVNDYNELKFRMWFKYGLKAQKLLAQGVWGLLAKLNLSNGILINIYYFQ